MLPTKIITQILLAFMVGIFIAVGIWLYRKGGEATRINIERQNNAAGNASDDARSNYDRCFDDGGVWDFGPGKCRGFAQSGRH